MLKAILYFVKEIMLPLQISEKSKADLGSMPHLGFISAVIVNK